MPEVSIIAVAVAAGGSLVIGGLWYSPLMFAKLWQREAGLSDEQLAGANMPVVFGLTLVLSAFAAYIFGMFIGPDMPLAGTVGAGIAAGLFWVGASFGINYLFERRSVKLWAINAGYHTLQFGMCGLCFGLLR